MYGLVNQAMKDLVTSKFGSDKWSEICQKAGHPPDDFEAMTSYPDTLTYSLVGAASQILGASASDLLRAFGDYWVTFTAHEGYGEIMDMFGKDFRSCLKNLNGMHGHMGAMMPQLLPPRFQVVETSASQLTVHYFSTRQGLAPMVIGLLEGLARKYGDTITIQHHPKDSRSDHDEFEVQFQG